MVELARNGKWGEGEASLNNEWINNLIYFNHTLAASKNTVSLMCLTPLRMTARATPKTHMSQIIFRMSVLV